MMDLVVSLKRRSPIRWFYMYMYELVSVAVHAR
jgi:hypothetical protein